MSNPPTLVQSNAQAAEIHMAIHPNTVPNLHLLWGRIVQRQPDLGDLDDGSRAILVACYMATEDSVEVSMTMQQLVYGLMAAFPGGGPEPSGTPTTTDDPGKQPVPSSSENLLRVVPTERGG